MKEILNDFVLPSGVLLTFIAATINIYFTRKNIKTTKYIDTVTTERIKWLSIIREEITQLISIISETLVLHKKFIQDAESQNPSEQYMDDVNYEYQRHYFDSLNGNSLIYQEKIAYQEIIKRLYLLKLRFNPKEDLEILNSIQYFIGLYAQKYISDNDIDDATTELSNLSEQTQLLLKKEWEKVKLETKGK
ncbi:hypothetical protein [Flavobacterium noncentrifugens]|uniref:DUF4760 domain-containing protein n=1 Tax=Flavobacterium noncentrifugens TaxID=1128970 RepID=A0A1G8SHW0_9FLAO|nr:hypothetical protein [Flavobacterium noncentrifugens]SDJ28753.1 hypothetical protein SAMN04487935_0562 [Flavobacterium noncentrifugens]